MDIEGIVVDDPRVNEQFFNRKLDIDVDSEGNAHIFFDQKLRFEIEPYQMETDEVCWARVDDYFTGEYTSRILSTFYTNGFDDGKPTGTIDAQDIIHIIYSRRIYDTWGDGHYSMDIDGNELSSYKHFITDDEWPGTDSFDAQYNNNVIALIGNYQNERYVYESIDVNNEIVDDNKFITNIYA